MKSVESMDYAELVIYCAMQHNTINEYSMTIVPELRGEIKCLERLLKEAKETHE